MEGFSFGGYFEDAAGRESITWHVCPTETGVLCPPDRRVPSFELRTVIRGVEFRGHDFDSLEPQDRALGDAAGLAWIPLTGELRGCLLSGALPCAIEDGGVRRAGAVHFDLDLLKSPPWPDGDLRVKTTVRGKHYEAVHRYFEDALQSLTRELPADVRLTCCLTCLLSDYDPAGHGLTGMYCHRDATEQYLAVRSKADYFRVPVTEIVMETYLCPQYRPRTAGTGYRG